MPLFEQAPPTSPERDGLADMVLDAKPLSLGMQMVNKIFAFLAVYLVFFFRTLINIYIFFINLV